MREREDRTGLRHPVAGDHVDAALERGAGERHRQRRAADDHFPAAEVDAGGSRAAQHHLQDRRHAMRERHLLASDQPEQHVGHVAAGVDLLHAEHRRDVGKPPRVNVEHRRDRHVDVARRERRVRRVGERSGRRERVQHQLAMAVVDALGQPGRAGRVERRRPRVLVEIAGTGTKASPPRASTRTRRRTRAWIATSARRRRSARASRRAVSSRGSLPAAAGTRR